MKFGRKRVPREKLPGLVEAAKKAVEEEEDVLFAYLFGSALDESYPTVGDLDVAVYLREGCDDFSDFLRVAVDAGVRFRKLTGLPDDFLDVRNLRAAPPSAAIEIVNGGKLLFCRDRLELAEFLERTARKYLQIGEKLARVVYGR